MPNRSGRKSLTVRLSNQQNRIPLPFSKLKAVGAVILEALGFRHAEVSFLFISGRCMKTLNRRYKGKNRTTDVLAFSQLEGKQGPALKKIFLGDVIISADDTRRQAPLYGNSFEKELVLYMVHGVLHLLGHDDERPGPKKIMRYEEKRIMKKIHTRLPSLWP